VGGEHIVMGSRVSEAPEERREDNEEDSEDEEGEQAAESVHGDALAKTGLLLAPSAYYPTMACHHCHHSDLLSVQSSISS
jgi:hypothetical protein